MGGGLVTSPPLWPDKPATFLREVCPFTMTRRLLLAALSSLLIVPPARARGQMTQDAQPTPPSASTDETPAKSVSVFDQLFPVPTGTNGYEEIIRAAERLKGATAPYPNPRTGLSVKRAYLADPACRGAFSLLRQGLRKPIQIIFSPEKPAYFPSAIIRALARLVSFHVAVGLADGEAATTVSDAPNFVRFADVVKAQSLVMSLTGGAIEQVVLTLLTRLRDSWSDRDAVRILAFARVRAGDVDPALAALAAERKIAMAFGMGLRDKPEELKSHFDYLTEQDESEGTTRAETFAEQLGTNPGLRTRVFAEVPSTIDAYFDRNAMLLADPTRRISLRVTEEESSRFHTITLFLRDSLMLGVDFGVVQPVKNRVVNQMLGIHAAVRRHRWENDRLPKSLEELKLPANLLTDPFTGAPLLYEPEKTGTGYELASAGALLPGEDGKPDAHERFVFPRRLVPSVP